MLHRRSLLKSALAAVAGLFWKKTEPVLADVAPATESPLYEPLASCVSTAEDAYDHERVTIRDGVFRFEPDRGCVGLLTQELVLTLFTPKSRPDSLPLRSQTLVTLGLVCGPKEVVLAFLARFGDVQNAATNTLHVSVYREGEHDRPTVHFTVPNLVVTATDYGASSDGMMVVQSVGMLGVGTPTFDDGTPVTVAELRRRHCGLA